MSGHAMILKWQILHAYVIPVCFTHGTLIHTPTGIFAIEEIKPGQMVYSMNLETGQIEPKGVTDIVQAQADRIIRVITGNLGVVESTPEHPYHANGDWVKAGELRTGDLITTPAERSIIKEVHHVNGRRQVRDLHIADYGNYFVGSDSLLVHNK